MRDLPKYIYRRGKKYHLMFNHKFYGSFQSVEDAVERKKQLMREKVIKPRRIGQPFKKYEDRYVYLNSRTGRYHIRKNVGGRPEHFGTYRRLEDARAERDYLESIGWDYSNME